MVRSTRCWDLEEPCPDYDGQPSFGDTQASLFPQSQLLAFQIESVDLAKEVSYVSTFVLAQKDGDFHQLLKCFLRQRWNPHLNLILLQRQLLDCPHPSSAVSADPFFSILSPPAWAFAHTFVWSTYLLCFRLLYWAYYWRLYLGYLT